MGKLDQIAMNIQMAEQSCYRQYQHVFSVNYDLDRKLVSYQGAKTDRVSRWCKYKEAFSASFVRYIMNRLSIEEGRILDPFAGSGTSLFTTAELGLDSVGIEFMPNALAIMDVRKSLAIVDRDEVSHALDQFADGLSWECPGLTLPFKHLAITNGAFCSSTEVQLGRYRYEASEVSESGVRRLLGFAAICVLEEISYTSKDGQYLRWDSRASGRISRKTKFRKPTILSFTNAITKKLQHMVQDISCPTVPSKHLKGSNKPGTVAIIRKSALDVLPSMESLSMDGLLTSPPYCNRYDYTRTYALELAMLGVGEEELKLLRQSMLSCTVENKEKTYLYGTINPVWDKANEAFEEQELLQLILLFLEGCLKYKQLNNNGIPRMVANYFKEMAFVIFECARILKPGSPLIMVNDNVRYQGIHIPVDLILADIAQKAGFGIEHVWVLPSGKGSSSQQTIAFGPEKNRKCVYIWRKS